MPSDRDLQREFQSRSVDMRERTLRAVDDLLESNVNLRDVAKLLKEGNDRLTQEIKDERARCELRVNKALERADKREANQRDFIKWLIYAIIAVSFGKEGLQLLVSFIRGG